MLPQLNIKQDNASAINQFAGLNRNLVISEGEFSEMKNMTNDYYPVFANRTQRGVINIKPTTGSGVMHGMLGGDKLAYVMDDSLYYDYRKICDLDETGNDRQMTMMGAYLVVFPDGVVYNTYTEEISYVKQENVASKPTMTLCKLDGTNLSDNTESGPTEPTDKTKYWLDTSAIPIVLKIYSESSSMWVSMGTTYVKISGTDIGKNLSAYDSAYLSGFDKYPTEGMFDGWDFNGSNIIYKCTDDYIVVAGLIDKEHTNTGEATVCRDFPHDSDGNTISFDFVAELDNRIWACSSDNHEIYACKQGSPWNWIAYAGLDSDSYAATIGTQGDFTGMAAYGGYMFFFKETGYHKLYGTKPSNYELQWKPGRGVQKGSDKSICIVNEYMVFKAKDAVCLYDGSITPISDKLGATNYYDACGGVYRTKYYVSMRDADYNWFLFVYDTAKGTWCQEDYKQYRYMAYTSDGLYMIDTGTDLYMINSESMRKPWFPGQNYPSNEIYPGKSEGADLDEFDWEFSTGDIGYDSPYNCYIKRINLRMEMAADAELTIEVMYDSSDDWKQLMKYYCTRKRSFEIPVPVERADHFRLRFLGHGDIKLYSIAKVTEQGSGK